ncbi:MAG TPA: 3-isopropylmalate dehydratase large subunit [Vicinamibacterales bacterium]|nr:3-isopropylmalate dehydratase large subunit [Vicinamibacterales bacterium]
MTHSPHLSAVKTPDAAYRERRAGAAPATARTLLDRLWDAHTVTELDQGRTLLYVDLHLVHEVTSPQAFSGLAAAGRAVRRPDRTFATVDHNVPTTDRRLPITDQLARAQLEALRRHAAAHGIPLFDLASGNQGIVHVIGPELGLTQPGMTIVCGDSHTTTHGAFGALAFGIGTTEVEQVLATQCLVRRKPQAMRVVLDGQLTPGVTAKDVALAVVGRLGMAGGTGHVIEFAGTLIPKLSMEQRMTLCNMSIEAGATASIVPPDDVTFSYVAGRRYAPREVAWPAAVTRWRQLASDAGASFSRTLQIDVSDLTPLVTWGTRPDMVMPITGAVPDPQAARDSAERDAMTRALAYMGLEPGTPMRRIAIDRVFIGSCTNARLEDLREAAGVARGHRIHDGVRAMVVPGSERVKHAAEREGLHRVFLDAGFEWREPGCSMCLGMNPDTLQPGERSASTSNRNFEGRQGRGGRTHLVSPAMAAAAAVRGHFDDVRDWEYR